MWSRTAMSAFLNSLLPAVSQALCPHFGECGGCSFQNVPYEDQLKRKASRVVAALSFIKGLPEPRVHPSPDLRYYRNKMEFSFGDVYPPVPGGPTVKLGLKPKGRWHQILDLQECFLLSPETPRLLAAVRNWAQDNKLSPYNGHKKQGFLRHLVVREAKNTGERMVVLVTNSGEMPKDSFLAAVQSVYPATTVVWGIHEAVSDVAISERLSVLSGSGHITEVLRFKDRELKFRISPHSFFQTNTRAANELYGVLRDWAREKDPEAILDLYCGGGGIALSLAGLCRKMVGVESCASSVEDARENARENGLANAEFYAGATEILLPALLAMGPQVAVSDPPRAGMHAAARAALAAAGPRTLICVSCNPESLARELEGLSPAYRVEGLEVFDLFPHTEHVETAVLLCRHSF